MTFGEATSRRNRIHGWGTGVRRYPGVEARVTKIGASYAVTVGDARVKAKRAAALAVLAAATPTTFTSTAAFDSEFPAP